MQYGSISTITNVYHSWLPFAVVKRPFESGNRIAKILVKVEQVPQVR